MNDHWRIVYDWHDCLGGFREWGYKLQRKKKFLWWTYWERHGGASTVEELEDRRKRILEKESRKFKVMKEWK